VSSGKSAKKVVVPPWEKEIIELHEFFQGWLGGELEATDEVFQRLERVLGEAFHLITPDGKCLEREPLLQSLRQAAGTRPRLRIGIQAPRLHQEGASHLIVTYEEWQQEQRVAKGRLSTVIFRRRKALPNGLEWIHVHETWLGDRAL
jgi:hypothetical protein